jgi:hypothetical protein
MLPSISLARPDVDLKRAEAPVREARLPVASKRADLAGLGHAAQGVVFTICNHHVAGRVHRDAGRDVEARIVSLAVLEALKLVVLVPRDEGELPRGRQQLQRVCGGPDQAVAVGHHALTTPRRLSTPRRVSTVVSFTSCKVTTHFVLLVLAMLQLQIYFNLSLPVTR